MRNEGRRPASIKMSESIDAVVVFPLVPATARQRRVAQMAASMPGTGHHRGALLGGGDDLGLVGATAGEYVTAWTVAHVLRPMTDGHRDALGPQPGGHG